MAVASAVMSLRDMRTHVVKLVRKVQESNGIAPGAPWQEVVKKLNLPPVELRYLLRGQDGCRQDRRIVINKAITCNERREFTVFHEIIHILIADDGEIESSLLELVEYGSDDYHWQIESLCNLGAAEFLMPSEEFKQLMDRHEWEISKLEATRGAFRCSLIAAAFHFTHHNPDPCSLVVCEVRQAAQKSEFNSSAAVTTSFSEIVIDRNNSDNNFQDSELFVAYTMCNEGALPMQRHKAVPHGHLIYSASTTRGAVEGKAEPLFKNGGQWPMRCYAAYIEGRIYAVFYYRERKWQVKRFQTTMDDLFAA